MESVSGRKAVAINRVGSPVGMSATPARFRNLKRLALLATLLVLAATAGVATYGTALYHQVEMRFAGRRWSLPSRVYSDTTLIFPEMRFNRALLARKLERLGYRAVNGPPRREGEMRWDGPHLDLFLRALDTPAAQREAMAVRLRLDSDRVAALQRLDSGEGLPLVELEPEEIALFFGAEREQRQLVAIDSVPPQFVAAVLAAEDGRFFDHHGLDWRGILRAGYINLRHGEIRQGGSTITQQLAKNYFLTPDKTLARKLKELLLAIVIELRYTKPEILEIYLNEIYLGQKGSVSINGVSEAARFYFGKPLEHLTLAESAAIAGLIRGPNAYSPHHQPQRCLERRQQVLAAMQTRGSISADELAAAAREPLSPVRQPDTGRVAPYFVDFLTSQLNELYAPQALTALGLSIHTSLDTMVQLAAEQALENGLARIEQSIPADRRTEPGARLQGAVVVMQPQTGAILAMVGGRSYAQSQFNRATQAKRQAGSTFKPFTYLAALDSHTALSPLSNEPRTYEVNGRSWSPDNYDAFDTPRVSLREALARSVNRATVDLAMQVGLENVAQTASAFGFSTPLPGYPSLALGAMEVIPLELARAYCVFAGAGARPLPLTLRDVRDEQRQVIEKRHMSVQQVISPAKAFLMTTLLRSVVTQGTARGLAAMGVTFPVAGKTGTTNDGRDAWFVGYAPDLLALVWVGFDNGDPLHASGASAALPIWAELMRHASHRISGRDFRVPPGVVERLVCASGGFPDVSGDCSATQPEWFLAENQPVMPAELSAPSPAPVTAVRGFFRKLLRRLKSVGD
jgi:penicillin-binding protein 1B